MRPLFNLLCNMFQMCWVALHRIARTLYNSCLSHVTLHSYVLTFASVCMICVFVQLGYEAVAYIALAPQAWLLNF